MTMLLLILLLVVCFIWFIIRYDNGHGGFNYVPAVTRADATTQFGSVTTVWFPAVDGAKLEGWLYVPHAARLAPLVIMAPGLTGTKEGHLERFAWRFVEEGLAVLSFDFRTFGGSEGQPRHWVDPVRQSEDYLAAINYAASALKNNDAIDPSRIALWGSSFSGGTAIATAAIAPNVSAVVAQCPYLKTSPQLEPKALVLAKYIAWTTCDLTRQMLSKILRTQYRPIYIVAFGQPGEFSFAPSKENPSRFNAAQKGSAFWTELPSALRGGWENKMLVRFLADFDKFQPMENVSTVQCPILFVAAKDDDMIPLNYVSEGRSLAVNANSEFETYACGHFGLYVDPIFQDNASRQAKFLARSLVSND